MRKVLSFFVAIQSWHDECNKDGMNKTKLIQLALTSPRTPETVNPISVSILMKHRVDSITFASFFMEISGLSYDDVKYTIKHGEYPWSIQEEQANKIYAKLTS